METEGPACSAAARAVLTNKPAPIMAPIPSITSEGAVSVLFNVSWPSDLACSMSSPIGLTLSNILFIYFNGFRLDKYMVKSLFTSGARIYSPNILGKAIAKIIISENSMTLARLALLPITTNDKYIRL